MIFANTWLNRTPALLLALDSGHRLGLKHRMLQTLLTLDLSLSLSQGWQGWRFHFAQVCKGLVFPAPVVYSS